MALASLLEDFNIEAYERLLSNPTSRSLRRISSYLVYLTAIIGRDETSHFADVRLQPPT